jgi:hypothetical protein
MVYQWVYLPATDALKIFSRAALYKDVISLITKVPATNGRKKPYLHNDVFCLNKAGIFSVGNYSLP